jgi:hypothetical protein
VLGAALADGVGVTGSGVSSVLGVKKVRITVLVLEESSLEVIFAW